MRILLTGSNGFIGHHFVEYVLKNTDHEIIGLDKLTYAAEGFDRIRAIDAMNNPRCRILTYDLAYPLSEGMVKELSDIDVIIHMGADSHVDRSINDPVSVVHNNINSTLYMLEYARTLPNLKKFLYFSTDEVYGCAPEGISFEEGDRFNPGNPYSASKAAGELLCYAYHNTYHLPIQITSTMNVIGERQHPEKFLPAIVNMLNAGKEVPVWSSVDGKPGSRFYIDAKVVANAVLYIIEHINETLDNIDAGAGKFNIVGEEEIDNLQFLRIVAGTLDKKFTHRRVYQPSNRPGYDLRYDLKRGKLERYGWERPLNIRDSIANITRWYFDEKNKNWL